MALHPLRVRRDAGKQAESLYRLEYCHAAAVHGAAAETARQPQQLDIGKEHFNALVEVLQQSMDAKGVPFRAQNAMLARLAPMHRDIIMK